MDVTPAPTVTCRRCGASNRPGISFCANCGQRLVAADDATLARPGGSTESAPCPRCGAPNRAGAAFCAECGFNIRPAVAPAGTAVPATGATVAGITAPPTSEAPPAAAAVAVRAWLGPLVLVVAAVGMAAAWFLPFFVGGISLADQALGTDGYGIAFWTAYPSEGILESAYFGLAAPIPVLVALLLGLAAVGAVRGIPGRWQRVGLGAALAWCAALAILFVVVEIGSGLGGGLIDLLRGLSPAGLIAFLSGLIGAIGITTRLAGG